MKNMTGGQITEALLWCPACRDNKFVVMRIPAGNEGVYQHELRAIDGAMDHLNCDHCHNPLERRHG